MNELVKVFENNEFGKIRTVEEDGKILFCGSDVAKALGYAVPRKALFDHCKGVLKRNTPTNGGVQEMSFISEGDVYRLIAHSKLPNAEKFESWIFDEVLPTIRKTGGYVVEDREEEFINIYFPSFSDDVKLSMVQDLRKQNQTLKAGLDVLSKENTLLSEAELQWANRKFIEAAVRKYASYAYDGDFASAWKDFKKELLYKHSINLNSRITKYLNNTGKRTKPKTLDMLGDGEVPKAVGTIVALCRERNVDLSDLIQKLSENENNQTSA